MNRNEKEYIMKQNEHKNLYLTYLEIFLFQNKNKLKMGNLCVIFELTSEIIK